jgi:hypothetical protein
MFLDQTLVNDIKNALGTCDNATLYRRISDAVILASDQCKSTDWNVGQMDICVCDGSVTLPADVATVLAVNRGGMPTLIRDQWFQYHINGSGSTNFGEWNYTDELGPVVTYRDPSAPVKLVAVVENALDSNQVGLRVFGWDKDGKRIYTTGPDGILEDGFLVPTIYGFSGVHPDAPSIARIDRIKKNVTNGFVRLLAIDPVELTSHTQIGYYHPWETVPSYRRIRVGDRSWLRIKYRRKDLEVRGMGDWINIENRQALILFCKAVKFRLDDQLERAVAYEKDGLRLISNQAESLRPSALTPPQIIVDSTAANLGPEDSLGYY